MRQNRHLSTDYRLSIVIIYVILTGLLIGLLAGCGGDKELEKKLEEAEATIAAQTTVELEESTTEPGSLLSPTPSQTPIVVPPPPATVSTPPPETVVPPPGEDEVWFNSYPAGAEVYVVPATVDIYDLELDDVMQANNLLGTAPFTYELSAGNYYVVPVFTQDLFTAAGYELPTYSDPTFDLAFPFDGNSSQNMSFIAGEEIGGLSKIYQLFKRGGNSESLISIALPLPENQRGQSKPSLYPTLATVETLPVSYTFEDTLVGGAIEENLNESNLSAEVGPDMVDEMIEVLSRVGKVTLDASDARLIIQMKGTDSDGFAISTYGS